MRLSRKMSFQDSCSERGVAFKYSSCANVRFIFYYSSWLVLQTVVQVT